MVFRSLGNQVPDNIKIDFKIGSRTLTYTLDPNLSHFLVFLSIYSALAGGVSEGCDAVSNSSRPHSTYPSRWNC